MTITVKNSRANPGDLFLCKDGDAHGIKNTGDEELTFMALILKK